jgi:hypothetical protein
MEEKNGVKGEAVSLEIGCRREGSGIVAAYLLGNITV